MAISFRWLGNAGFEFRLGSTILLVDPFLTRPHPGSLYTGRVAVDKKAIHENIDGCNHILVSHTHFDHFMDVPEVARQTGAVIHGSANTCSLAHRLGVHSDQTHLIFAGSGFALGGIHVQAITARHPWIPGYTRGLLGDDLQPPLRLRDYRMDTCLSFLVTFRGMRILVWSSNRSASADKADVLVCRAVSGRRWYMEMMDLVQPSQVIPSHWDDMFLPLSEPPRPFFAPPRLALPPIERIDLDSFARKIINVSPGSAVLVPERFRRYILKVG